MKNFLRKLFDRKEPEAEQPDIIECLFYSLLLRQIGG
jgi:hypothetical protein